MNFCASATQLKTRLVGQTTSDAVPPAFGARRRTRLQERQCLQRFAQAHFVGQNSAEIVLRGESAARPRRVFGTGAARFPSAPERRAFQLRFAALLRGALTPVRRAPALASRVLRKARLEKAGLGVG